VHQAPTYSTVIKKSSDKTRKIKVRSLKETMLINHQNYLVTLKQVYDELDKMAWNIYLSVLVAFGVFLLIMLLVILLISNRLWNPFYQIIDQLGKFRIDRPYQKQIKSNVNEFRMLDNTLSMVMNYANKQYVQQKQFTENASHEIQTPLAIALANLESLMQAKYLQDKELLHAHHSQEALQRISNLTNGLLLLAKIENHHFHQVEQVNVSVMLKELLKSYDEFMIYQELSTEVSLDEPVMVKTNRFLLEVLFTNLIKNSVKHNVKGGKIWINLQDRFFSIRNTGNPLPFLDDHIFSRFVKASSHQDSTGLGLAIVKQIAELHQMKISYQYLEAGQHEFSLGF
jgi:signal transduction histidine kinase